MAAQLVFKLAAQQRKKPRSPCGLRGFH